MRYIVLYIIAIAWITSGICNAQKPALDLLPASHDHLHPEAVIDTSQTPDSLIHFTPESNNIPSYDSGSRSSLYSEKDRRPVKKGSHPLIIIKTNPIGIFFSITALNI